MTQTHDTPPERRALVLLVYVSDANPLLDNFVPPSPDKWDLGDVLVDRLATICRDTEWSPDAFGAYSAGDEIGYTIMAYGDVDPSDVDRTLVREALDAVDGVRVLDAFTLSAVDARG